MRQSNTEKLTTLGTKLREHQGFECVLQLLLAYVSDTSWFTNKFKYSG